MDLSLICHCLFIYLAFNVFVIEILKSNFIKIHQFFFNYQQWQNDYGHFSICFMIIFSVKTIWTILDEGKLLMIFNSSVFLTHCWTLRRIHNNQCVPHRISKQLVMTNWMNVKMHFTHGRIKAATLRFTACNWLRDRTPSV